MKAVPRWSGLWTLLSLREKQADAAQDPTAGGPNVPVLGYVTPELHGPGEHRKHGSAEWQSTKGRDGDQQSRTQKQQAGSRGWQRS